MAHSIRKVTVPVSFSSIGKDLTMRHAALAGVIYRIQWHKAQRASHLACLRSPGRLVKRRHLGLIPRLSNSVILGWRAIIFISYKFAATDGPGNTLFILFF